MIVVRNQSDYSKIEDVYKNIINSALKTYLATIKSCRIISISLIGSVSRGEAIPEISDIDFVAITKRLIDHNEKRALYKEANRICNENPIVSRVDLDTIPYLTFLEDRRFQFVLKTDSVLLKGRSMYKDKSYEYNKEELISLSSPMMSPLIESYRNGLTHPNLSPKEVINYSHWVGKDMLKCFRRLVIEQKNEFPKSASSIYASLLDIMPEEKALFDKLAQLASNPTDKVSVITNILDAMQDRMSHFFN